MCITSKSKKVVKIIKLCSNYAVCWAVRTSSTGICWALNTNSKGFGQALDPNKNYATGS